MPIAIVTDDQEVEISGSAVTLRTFQASLAEFLLSAKPSLQIEASAALDPSPYPKALSQVKFILDRGPTKVTVDGSTLAIEGSRANLQRFGSFLKFESHDTDVHSHYEYIPGDPYISPESLPVIVSCTGAGE